MFTKLIRLRFSIIDKDWFLRRDMLQTSTIAISTLITLLLVVKGFHPCILEHLWTILHDYKFQILGCLQKLLVMLMLTVSVSLMLLIVLLLPLFLFLLIVYFRMFILRRVLFIIWLEVMNWLRSKFSRFQWLLLLIALSLCLRYIYLFWIFLRIRRVKRFHRQTFWGVMARIVSWMLFKGFSLNTKLHRMQ